MASSSLLSQISDDFLECKVCYEPYKIPKVLACLHTFCLECLEQSVEKQGERNRVFCPTCRTPTSLPEGGVTKLKDNFFVESLRDTVDIYRKIHSKHEDVMCSNCLENSPEAASARCLSCDEFLCPDCVNAHKRVRLTRGHCLVALDTIRASNAESPLKNVKAPMCEKHDNQVMRFFCTTCRRNRDVITRNNTTHDTTEINTTQYNEHNAPRHNTLKHNIKTVYNVRIPVCHDCTVIDHKEPDHENVYLSELVDETKETLTELSSLSEGRIHEIKVVQSALSKTLLTLEENKASVKHQLATATEKLKKRVERKIDKQHKLLSKKLSEICSSREKELNIHEDFLETTSASLKSSLEFVRKVLSHGSDFDMMDVSKEIEERMTSLLEAELPNVNDVTFQMVHLTFLPSHEPLDSVVIGTIEESRAIPCKKFLPCGHPCDDVHHPDTPCTQRCRSTVDIRVNCYRCGIPIRKASDGRECWEVPQRTIDHVQRQGVECIVLQTESAVDEYNKMASAGKKVGGVFHSTC
ncbi:E3 ubiquitin-protein ligase TRIM56-like [Branchiostoma floridae]|uniref:E3 ubiquitin-protein ligase TRIM56-like n=1 Tax=Branchiostoma floridae TaxID=7739 RepID=A0A9J7KL85_BRAFL|nr:E3 ubiquitin-protein ligase TRIM56-like [Branchiostoma floridae]